MTVPKASGGTNEQDGGFMSFLGNKIKHILKGEVEDVEQDGRLSAQFGRSDGFVVKNRGEKPAAKDRHSAETKASSSQSAMQAKR